jgi:hypothetical protein
VSSDEGRPWWRRLVSGGAERVAGDPPSGNGASSFHLGWALGPDAGPDAELVSAEVTLEVLTPPSVPRLYFWAMQTDFGDGRGRRAGGAHLGLQWYPRHPGSTAVNWGGYTASGGELRGGESPLPSATGNPNTRDLAWRAGVGYRLVVRRVEGASAGTVAWRGVVEGPDGPVVVRDLYADGDRIVGVTMWSEVFARCDHPSVAVRWSDPVVVTATGGRVAPASVTVSYQSHPDGGCANTDSSADEVGLVQRTCTARITGAGSRLPVPQW